MRSLLALSLVVLSIGACSSNGDAPDLAVGPDLAVANDLAMHPDLSASQLGCGGVIQCLQGGGGAACVQNASPHAQVLLQALLGCGQTVCSDTDAGSGDCSGPGDTSTTCLQCAFGQIQGGSCPNELNACIADG